MTPFIFRAEQFVPRPLDEVFGFFSKADNLQQLTPPWLHFRILSVDPLPVRKGTLIRYKLWHHEHRFLAEGNGTRITDEVQYLLPFGVLGSIAHRLTVKNDVETIF